MLKNVVRVVAVGLVSLSLVGCSSFWNKFDKTVDGLTSGDYHVTVWSGGVAVKEFDVKNTFINSEVGTDGYFFYKDGKLVRISGTVTVEEVK